jgi:hypothetical protein
MAGPAVLQRRRAGDREARRAFLGTARAALKPFGHGSDVVIATGGQFSLAGLLAAVVARLGAPAALTITCWTAARRAIGDVRRLMGTGRVSRVRWWLDPSYPRRHPAYWARLLEAFGADAVRLAPVHMKAITVRTADGWAVTIRGSLNLNRAIRAELIEVSDDEPLTAFVEGLVADVFARVPVPEASGVSRADEAVTLARAFGVDVAAAWEAGAWLGPVLDDAGRPGFSEGV